VVTVVVLREEDIKEVLEVDMDDDMQEDVEEGEVDPPLVLIKDKHAIYQDFVPNHVLFVGTATAQNMLQRIFLTY